MYCEASLQSHEFDLTLLDFALIMIDSLNLLLGSGVDA